ncbi:MAG: hypothetical protein RLZZ272_1144 [Actinomycetota bacterium]
MSPSSGGLLLLALAALAGAGVATALASRRAARAARTIAAWLGSGRDERLELAGRGGWRALAMTLGALGASHRALDDVVAERVPRLAAFVEAIIPPALVFSSSGRLVAANAAARELTGIGDDVVGLTVVQALSSTAIVEAVQHVRANRTPVTLEVERAGRELRVSVSMVGHELLVVLEDRTRERRIEDVRRDFVVNASHELKTPVTSIQTLAEALEITLRSDASRAPMLAKRLVAESERLARLVGDLLDLRRLEEPGPLERTSVDLAEVVRRTVAELLPRAEARDVHLEVDLPGTARLAAVPADVDVIVKNLVSNAIKYNEDGGSVEVRVTSEDGLLILTVADTGIGIPQQDHARVFERFYRVDTARSRATGGTGLGLAIVRHAVERHGGSIGVTSLLGEGTTFTVRLPVGAAL